MLQKYIYFEIEFDDLEQKEYSDLLVKSVSTKKIEPSKKSPILREKFVEVAPCDY